MKNTLKITMFAGSAVLALAVFAIAFGAFPSSAHAYFYGSPDCPYPTVYSNGYYTCSQQSVSYQPPSYYYPTPQPPTYPTLSASCYASNTSVQQGNSVQWIVNANGGNGSYSYSWSGTDGLSGNNASIYMTYYSAGTKSGQVSVYSNGQTITVNCGNSVTVYNSNYYQPPTYNPYPPVYYPPTYYNPLSASCVANVNAAGTGNTVTWTAQASGGNGYYTYSWNGTDGIYGQGQSITYTYATPGTKYASVTVMSNGQSYTQPCSNYVNVNTGYIAPYGSSNAGLDIGCYADPTTADPNQPVTWTAEVTGGAAPYTYSWTGSDGLTGSTASVIKYYQSRGSKSAIVTVTSADGRSGVRACSTALTVRGAGGNGGQTQQPAPQPQVQNGQNLSAAALFSFSNIPWGWVAILIILVLFATVMYLLFNKPKI